MKRRTKVWLAAFVLCVGVVLLLFHPSRPLYLQQRELEVRTDDGILLRGTLSLPRWSRGRVPGVVLVHGSGPRTRHDALADTRALVWAGFAVLAYDKRGAGASGGEYMRGSAVRAETMLPRLAADAAAVFDCMLEQEGVDPTRVGFFGASQAGWVIPLAGQRTRKLPRFHVLLSGPAVPTGVEHYYSDLTGDGTSAPQVTDRAEVERLVFGFQGDLGFDPLPVLQTCPVPTLWLLGDRDESVPTFASVRVLETLRAAGQGRHTVVRFANANHALVDVESGRVVPVWEEMMRWMEGIGVVEDVR